MFASAHETRNSTTEVDKTVRSFYFAGLGDTSHQTTVQCRYMQQEQIKAKKKKNSFQITLKLGLLALEELQW